MDSFLDRFHQATVLIIGDIMLDRYVWGQVRRISPEAPVPIVTVQRTTESLGGAGNVANNLVQLGCRATLVGLCGHDAAAQSLKALLSEKGITGLLFTDSGRPTITKTRIMAQKQQIIRLDEEIIMAPSQETLQQIRAYIDQEITGVQVIIISDYGKGLFQDAGFLQEIIVHARGKRIPVLVDPKGTDWQQYENATCMTPNTAELEAVVGSALEENEPALIAGARKIRQQLGLSYLLVTRGSLGMCLLGPEGDPVIIAAQTREVFDVSGAGDTVVATLAAALAAGLDFVPACRIANLAAGIVVGKLGTQPILFSELSAAVAASRMQGQFSFSASKKAAREADLAKVSQWKAAGTTIVFTNGCFDLLHPGHISLLHQARALGDRLIVGLNSDASIKRLKGEQRPFLKEQDRAALLSAMECVDLVVPFDDDTPLELINAIRPNILVKGADYALDQVVGRDIVEAYGGRVQLVPLIPGYSTTLLTRKMGAGWTAMQSKRERLI